VSFVDGGDRFKAGGARVPLDDIYGKCQDLTFGCSDLHTHVWALQALVSVTINSANPKQFPLVERLVWKTSIA
jgi:hypothetical protein